MEEIGKKKIRVESRTVFVEITISVVV